jgi:hypothetical protein
MLVTPHAVVGATIGALIPARRVALPAALTSHFLLDIVPHWQETLPPYTPHRGTWFRVPVDLTLASLLTWWIAGRGEDRGRVWWSALAGVTPDLDFLWFLAPDSFGRMRVFQGYVSWHSEIQRETSRLWGLVPQLAVIALCGAMLRSRSSEAR